jgi:hypothetical protein
LRARADGRRLAVLATIGSATATGIWVWAVAATAGHGFDTTDEGFYLLSYRWWDSNFRTFTGVQFLYGPVFQALGHNIAGLRLFRLFTVLAAHLVFGCTLMAWLRGRRTNAPKTRWWQWSGVAAVLAFGGMSYSWLPLSPGYNDVSMLGALLGASAVLVVARAVDRDEPVPLRLPLALGPLVVAMLLAKWASALLTLVVLLVAVTVVLAPRRGAGRRGWTPLLRLVAWTAVGVLGALALVQLFVVPLTVALPQMLATNRMVAAATNSPSSLLVTYLRSVVDMTGQALSEHRLLLAAAALAALARRRVWQLPVVVLAVGGGVVSVRQALTHSQLAGGARNTDRYPVSLVAVLAVALVVVVVVLLDRRAPAAPGPALRPPSRQSSLRHEGLRGWVVLGMLAVLPFTQAAGTGNPIMHMALDGFAAWGALVIVALTGIEGAPAPARAMTAAAAAGCVAISSIVATGASWVDPYRTAGMPAGSAVVVGVPALSSVGLDPTTAAAFSRLHAALAGYVSEPGRPVMGFDEMAGVVLLLDGRPVGEAWYSAIDRRRTAAGIRRACPGGRPTWGPRPPILLFNRAVSTVEIKALSACGLSFEKDYRLLSADTGVPRLKIYVPTVPDTTVPDPTVAGG